MTIQELAAQINAAGFKICNLFQIEDGARWQANLYVPASKEYFGFSYSTDPIETLQMCFDKARANDKTVPTPPPSKLASFLE